VRYMTPPPDQNSPLSPKNWWSFAVEQLISLIQILKGAIKWKF
jgi:hypothetical protein